MNGSTFGCFFFFFNLYYILEIFSLNILSILLHFPSFSSVSHTKLHSLLGEYDCLQMVMLTQTKLPAKVILLNIHLLLSL